jgi:hypothetical protein
MPAWVYRFCASGSVLIAFLGMSYLYGFGARDLYEQILRAYGVVAFRFPFVDISGSLAAWECARQGLDVIWSDPCDVLHRGYTYSPLWMAAAGIPLGMADTPAVGWSLDLVFILSLSLLPPPKRGLELMLVIAATLSTMVVFALERANPDIFLFELVLAAGLLAQGQLAARLFGYGLALLAALLKYYPIMALIIIFRERIAMLLALVAILLSALAVFWAGYHVEIARGLPNIPHGQYNLDLFAAQNLPFMLAEVVGNTVGSPVVERAIAVGLYASLVAASISIWWRLSRLSELSVALASLPPLERDLLVIGSAVIVGCFFAGQSIGYRGVFLLLVVPGWLALSRCPICNVRIVALVTSLVTVLLMWGECFRLALYAALDHLGTSEPVAAQVKFLFWLVRELAWWWTVSVMLVTLTDFLRTSPTVRDSMPLLDRLLMRQR